MAKTSWSISILSALAELESQQKSIAIKEGIRYRMQEGLYKFSVKNTIGYYRDYSGRVKIEPAEAEIVHYIYDTFLEGASAAGDCGFAHPTGNPVTEGYGALGPKHHPQHSPQREICG